MKIKHTKVADDTGQNLVRSADWNDYPAHVINYVVSTSGSFSAPPTTVPTGTYSFGDIYVTGYTDNTSTNVVSYIATVVTTGNPNDTVTWTKLNGLGGSNPAAIVTVTTTPPDPEPPPVGSSKAGDMIIYVPTNTFDGEYNKAYICGNFGGSLAYLPLFPTQCLRAQVDPINRVTNTVQYKKGMLWVNNGTYDATNNPNANSIWVLTDIGTIVPPATTATLTWYQITRGLAPKVFVSQVPPTLSYIPPAPPATSQYQSGDIYIYITDQTSTGYATGKNITYVLQAPSNPTPSNQLVWTPISASPCTVTTGAPPTSTVTPSQYRVGELYYNIQGSGTLYVLAVIGPFTTSSNLTWDIVGGSGGGFSLQNNGVAIAGVFNTINANNNCNFVTTSGNPVATLNVGGATAIPFKIPFTISTGSQGGGPTSLTGTYIKTDGTVANCSFTINVIGTTTGLVEILANVLPQIVSGINAQPNALTVLSSSQASDYATLTYNNFPNTAVVALPDSVYQNCVNFNTTGTGSNTLTGVFYNTAQGSLPYQRAIVNDGTGLVSSIITQTDRKYNSGAVTIGSTNNNLRINTSGTNFVDLSINSVGDIAAGSYKSNSTTITNTSFFQANGAWLRTANQIIGTDGTGTLLTFPGTSTDNLPNISYNGTGLFLNIKTSGQTTVLVTVCINYSITPSTTVVNNGSGALLWIGKGGPSNRLGMTNLIFPVWDTSASGVNAVTLTCIVPLNLNDSFGVYAVHNIPGAVLYTGAPGAGLPGNRISIVELF